MGHSRLMRYVLKIDCSNATLTNQEWKTKVYGKPTTVNLLKHLKVVRDSSLPGGVNERAGELHITGGRIYDQHKGQHVAECVMM